MKKLILPGALMLAMLFGCMPTVVEQKNSPDETARKYCEALNAANFEALLPLFNAYTKERLEKNGDNAFRAFRPSSCRVESVTTSYALIAYTTVDEPEEQIGTLYFLPNGHIKYDPIYAQHPALKLRGLPLMMESSDEYECELAYKRMSAWDIPMFGFDPYGAAIERSASAAELHEWIRENEATFDVGEPPIPLSLNDLKLLRDEPE